MAYRTKLAIRDYEQSTTYKRYSRLIGSLVENVRYSPMHNAYYTEIYLVKSVVPTKYYQNRFSYNLLAVGEHADAPAQCAKLHRLIKATEAKRAKHNSDETRPKGEPIAGWRILECSKSEIC